MNVFKSSLYTKYYGCLAPPVNSLILFLLQISGNHLFGMLQCTKTISNNHVVNSQFSFRKNQHTLRPESITLDKDLHHRNSYATNIPEETKFVKEQKVDGKWLYTVK